MTFVLDEDRKELLSLEPLSKKELAELESRSNISRGLSLLPTCKALVLLAQTDAPNYQQAGDQQKKCSLCEFYIRSTECDLYDFAADPDYVCDHFEERTPDVGELRAFVEQYGARNSRPDLSMLQQVHDLTVKLGAKCHREGPHE